MIAFEYILLDAGWADLVIITESARITVSASYILDSLHDLANAAIALCDRADRAEVRFMNEPGEHILRFERRKGEHLRATLFWYDESAKNGPPMKLLLETDTNVAQVRREVLRLLATILNGDGETEYERRWCAHPFPREAFETLKKGYKGPLPGHGS